MRIERNWGPGMIPSDEDISHAKWLGNNNTEMLYVIIIIENTVIIILLETKGILDSGLIENLAERVEGELNFTRSLPVITCAASLAHHGLLGSVRMRNIWLHDVDLTSVPAEHLASLFSSVTRCVSIKNVSGCDLVSILDSVKSKWISTVRVWSVRRPRHWCRQWSHMWRR